jgi:hypothetical protein
MTSAYTLRRATAADAEALARGAVEGVAGYGEFAAGWSGPGYEHELADARASLPDPEYHAIVAVTAAGAVAGQVTVVPATKAARPVEDPALGHLRNLPCRALDGRVSPRARLTRPGRAPPDPSSGRG